MRRSRAREADGPATLSPLIAFACAIKTKIGVQPAHPDFPTQNSAAPRQTAPRRTCTMCFPLEPFTRPSLGLLAPLKRPPSGGLFFWVDSGQKRFAADRRRVARPDYGAHWTCSEGMTHDGHQL